MQLMFNIHAVFTVKFWNSMQVAMHQTETIYSFFFTGKQKSAINSAVNFSLLQFSSVVIFTISRPSRYGTSKTLQGFYDFLRLFLFAFFMIENLHKIFLAVIFKEFHSAIKTIKVALEIF